MEIKQVTYSYDGKGNQLSNVDCTIEQGKITTIIGPNGSGKSTLLTAMANNLQPQKGQIILEDKQLSHFRAKELAKKIAVVHQHNSAPPDMTIERLVGYGRLPYQSMFSSQTEEDKAMIEWALKQTNLLNEKQKEISDLSGGERQRVWIAMTLAQQTSYLFLDEPTTYLDIYYQYEILDLIKRLNKEQKMTIVLVLHDLNQAIKYSDTIIVMKNGELVAKGSPKDIITPNLMKDIYGIDISIREDKEVGLYTIPIGI